MDSLNDQLLIACRLNKFDEIQSLVAQGADVNACALRKENNSLSRQLTGLGVFGKSSYATPLLVSVLYGEAETVAWLLQQGADVNSIDQNDFNPASILFLACVHERTASVRLLLEHGADVHFRNHFGNTPLTMACDAYEPEKMPIIEALMEYGANPNEKDNMGLTPIMQPVLSVVHFNLELLDYFLQHNLDVSIKNNDGQTVRDMLLNNKNYEAVGHIDAYLERRVLLDCLDNVKPDSSEPFVAL